MSFQLLSERLASLQESNVRLRELIVRLRETHWQPGSLPLNSDGDDVITELSTEIVQTLREQDDDLELLEEEAASLDAGHRGSELEERKVGFQEVIQRAIAELQECVFILTGSLQAHVADHSGCKLSIDMPK